MPDRRSTTGMDRRQLERIMLGPPRDNTPLNQGSKCLRKAARNPSSGPCCGTRHRAMLVQCRPGQRGVQQVASAMHCKPLIRLNFSTHGRRRRGATESGCGFSTRQVIFVTRREGSGDSVCGCIRKARQSARSGTRFGALASTRVSDLAVRPADAPRCRTRRGCPAGHRHAASARRNAGIAPSPVAGSRAPRRALQPHRASGRAAIASRPPPRPG